jgi:DNA polymerase-3 subunit gamma/tau
LSSIKPKNENAIINNEKENKQENFSSQITNNDTINQIKNVAQEKKVKPDTQLETKASNEIFINSFNKLLDICSSKKEMKLKYELEKNVNLVKFENGRIEISFNDNLDKDFVKDLSTKLFEWTNQRWIISFSKNKGEMSIKEKEKNKSIELIENGKNSELYKTMLNYFSDAELTDVKLIQKDDMNND